MLSFHLRPGHRHGGRKSCADDDIAARDLAWYEGLAARRGQRDYAFPARPSATVCICSPSVRVPDRLLRCFVYLFPSHQTWYLVFVFVAFTYVKPVHPDPPDWTNYRAIELFGFLVLNIGLPVITDLAGWEMFSDGLLQSLSVRAAGFVIVPIGDMAPSVL